MSPRRLTPETDLAKLVSEPRGRGWLTLLFPLVQLNICGLALGKRRLGYSPNWEECYLSQTVYHTKGRPRDGHPVKRKLGFPLAVAHGQTLREVVRIHTSYVCAESEKSPSQVKYPLRG
jgi:hypothetical protein